MARKSTTPRARAKANPAAPALAGELTIYHVHAIRDQLREHVATGASTIALAGVTDIDSAGFQLLLAAQASARAHGVLLNYVALSPAVQDLAATYRHTF